MATSRYSLLTITLVLTLLLSILIVSVVYSASSRDVVISEIAWMGTTVSANDEWVELYNNSAIPIDLTGWTLNAADGTPAISLNGTIPAMGYYLLERTDDSTVPGVAADQIYTGALGNTGENLTLSDGSSNVVDQIDNSASWFSGRGAGRVPMVRVDSLADGNRADNWTYNPRCGSATNSAGVSHTCELTTTNVAAPLSYSVYFDNLATTATVTMTNHTPMEDALLMLINGATPVLTSPCMG